MSSTHCYLQLLKEIFSCSNRFALMNVLNMDEKKQVYFFREWKPVCDP